MSYNFPPIKTFQSMGIPRDRIIEFDSACDSNYDLYYYLGVASINDCAEEAMKWIMGHISYELKSRNLDFDKISNVIPANVLNNFCLYLKEGLIDRTFSKKILSELFKYRSKFITPLDNGIKELNEILSRPEFKQIESNEIYLIIDKIIADNQEQFNKIKEQPKLIQWFVGQVMKESQGKANPTIITEYIRKLIV